MKTAILVSALLLVGAGAAAQETSRYTAEDSARVEGEPDVVTQDPSLDLAALRGVEHVCIIVRDIPDEAEANGLAEKQVYFEVAIRLSRAGVDVVPRDRLEEWPDTALLYVSVNLLDLDGLSYVYNLGVSLTQAVTLVRDPAVAVNASSWKIEELGRVPIAESWRLLESVGEKIDVFVSEYQAANS
jgi:hypothetical protein